jgi:hypothetical protein
VELGGDLVHFLGRIVRREGGGDAGEIVDLAAVRHAFDDLKLAWRIPGQRRLALSDAGDLGIIPELKV